MQAGIIILAGGMFMAVGILKMKHIGKKNCTMPSKAVIHEITPAFPDSSNINAGMVIRFPTKDMTWIKGKVNDYSPFYKLGETIDILYNEEDPNDFLVVSKKQNISYLVFVIVGGIVVGSGVLRLLRIL